MKAGRASTSWRFCQFTTFVHLVGLAERLALAEIDYHQVQEMAWCASFQLKSFRACRFHFGYGVLPRCSVCPLFDAERAIRDIMGENPPGNLVQLTLGPKLRALLAGELPPDLDQNFELPDFPPEGWGEPAGEEPPG